MISTHTTIHRRIKAFVKWIAPEGDTRERIRKQADEIISKIKPLAEADGLIIISTPLSGSFDKDSGLRRYMRGHSVEEGQDVDIAFIMEEKDQKGNILGCLVDKFRQYAEKAYPDTDIGNTKSSATICFSGSKLKFDLVPLFQTTRADIQRLKKSDGKERTTSVVKHTDFIRTRKNSSDAIDGVVRFNECIRLLKWWRTHQQEQSGVFGNEPNDDKVFSFLIDLLCARAYDNRSVQKTYAATLGMWFGFLANVVRNRKDVIFSGSAAVYDNPLWKVIDPIDNTNNLVGRWDNAKINELARWFENARDEMNRAVRYDEEEDDNAAMESLVKIFGNAFKNNCE